MPETNEMKLREDKICVLLTGGTICSLPDDDNKNYSDAKRTQTVLSKYYQEESGSPFQKKVDFEFVSLEMDILSENMTISVWFEILKKFREVILPKNYKGVIVLHGTDTLAYTSSFLSMALSGIDIPVCLVSAQLRLGEYHVIEENKKKWIRNQKTNGYANFRASVELIMNGIAPNIYVVYRNEATEYIEEHDPGAFLVHYGAHLLQCQNNSNNFHSRDEMHIPDTTNAHLEGCRFKNDLCLYKKMIETDDGIVAIRPYTNLNYTDINLEGKRIVIHGTYHSESVCIGRDIYLGKEKDRNNFTLGEIVDKDQNYSILYLLDLCKKRNIPVFLAPCDKKNAAYGTTANAIKMGAIPIRGITFEAAYAKAIIGISLGLDHNQFEAFMETRISDELS